MQAHSHHVRTVLMITKHNVHETMRGYVAEEVPGDGSCLFHALERHLNVPATTLRAQVVHVLQSRPHMQIEGTPLTNWARWYVGVPIHMYAADLAHRSSWGGALEIAVIAHLYKRSIRVYEPTDDNQACKRISVFQEQRKDHAPIRLLYANRSHYMPLFVAQ